MNNPVRVLVRCAAAPGTAVGPTVDAGTVALAGPRGPKDKCMPPDPLAPPPD